MRETAQQTLARLQKELPARRRQQSALHKRLQATRHRIRKLKDGIARRKVSDRERAVRWAIAQVGTVEHPAGSNRGPKISGWIRAGGGTPGWSWCQYFANVVAVHGGCPQIRDGYTVDVMKGAYAHLGFHPIPVDRAERGDMLFYKWPGVSSDPCDHVSIRVTTPKSCEGNTSQGASGSQSNGGGVFERDDHLPFAVGAVRVPYRS